MPPKNPAEQFQVWARAAERTNEELYTIELLVEQGWSLWCSRHERREPFDVEATMARAKKRRLNPAYRARISREKLDALSEVWSELRSFRCPGFDDRPLGEVETLRFFPQLTDVNLRGRFTSIAALATLRGLKTLSIDASALTDLSPLAGLPELERVWLTLDEPWPEVAVLARLPALSRLKYQGNLLALREVTDLPAVQDATFAAGYHWSTPLRNMHDLPAMPAVRHLRVECAGSLAGIDRWAPCNLQLQGPFADLGPLAGMRTVTWLRLEGQRFADLRPLARMPELRELRLERELPLDLAPLADAPRLRQAWVRGCDIVATELASINALLTPWSDDFQAAEPRPLAPLRFIAWDRCLPDGKEIADAKHLTPQPPDPRVAFYQDDLAYEDAENRWFITELNRRLDRVLGRGWRPRKDDSGYWSSHHGAGSLFLDLKRHEDLSKFRDVVQTLRELLATTRFPWKIIIFVEPHGDLDDDMDEIADRYDGELDEATAAEQDREDRAAAAQYRRERQAFLERQHRLRLLQEQGLPINPDDFAPDLPEETSEDEDEGDLEDGDDADSLGEMLGLTACLTESVLCVRLDEAGVGEYYYGEAPENWHNLPEPPAQRPRPVW